MTTQTRTLHLPAALLRGLADIAVEGYPHEVCGLLVGREDESCTRVLRFVRAKNLAVERSHDRYDLDPHDFLAADREARRDGLDVVGVWHTHPDHPARPSRTDLDVAWPDFSYLILAIEAGKLVDTRSWRLGESAFVEQPIVEEES
jgi:proteasome lid subunit RPN8/RPN11